MKNHLPPAAKEKYEELEEIQDEASAVVSQKEAAEEKLSDSEAALDALEGVEDEQVVHRQIGRIRIQSDSGAIRPKLEAEIEDLESRIEELEERKETLETKFENRKEDIKHLLGGQTGGLGTPGMDE